MGNEYYGAPTTPTSDYLAHYGIKGMKWGVRKARESGNARALGRQYRKAQRKLARLEKRAASGKKYAKRAALLGAGAAAAGGIAATGTRGIGAATRGVGKVAQGGANAVGAGLQAAQRGLQAVGFRKAGVALGKAGVGMRKYGAQAANTIGAAGGAVETWGKGKNIGKGLQGAGRKYISNATGIQGKATTAINQQLAAHGKKNLTGQIDKLGNISNSGYTRLAGAALGAGLAGAAGYNAYRAATTKRAARKAAEFRREMNKQFVGTQYANGGSRKRRRK